MTLYELDAYFNSFLKKENFAADPSRNGIQIQNSAPGKKKIKKAAFAVDASLDTAKEAARQGCDVLFVHHGLYWDGCEIMTDLHYQRVATFIKNDMALIGYHIPLDANKEAGNNYGMARRLGLKSCKDFCAWRGMTIGVKGRLPKAMTIEQLADAALLGAKPNQILSFGPKKISTVGIVSGGGGSDHWAAWKEGLDAYITGEIGHTDYNPIKEEGLNVIAGGHYNTETVGVQLVMKKLKEEKGIQGVFLDFPTQL
ncbi:MAG: Nif3-like dinuclear metal center hexameric protein [Treponema sp.]|nr:Nif3-like dinuclear metal center hexameric protein [Treponema sp.]MEE3435066.1 Nif3-like dinuclear metal center hexameric protein [Treponema sp.]